MQPIEKPKDYATRLIIAIVASLGILGVAFWIAVSRDTSSPQAPAQPAPSAQSVVVAPKEPDKSLEYKCAFINAGGFIPETDITVTRFRYLLSDLQKRSGYTQQQIADMNTFAVNTLRDKYGRNVKLLDFMEQSKNQLNLNADKLSYKEVVAAMITLIGSGQN
jgi:hypothetical protein